MTKNLEIIEKFLISEDKTLIINQVSDEIGSFYIFVVNELTNKSNKLIFNRTIPEKNIGENDLFGSSNIYIYNITNSKHIEEIMNNTSKKIILTDYKNYKKFKNNHLLVNGYNFEKDIRSFLVKYFNIDDEILIDFCITQPYFTYSETTKYKINNSNYSKDTSVNNANKSILDVRKDIFNAKKSQIDIRKLFLLLKDEAHQKKFSFLTY